MVLSAAQSIIRKSDPTAPKLSDKWVKRFFARHPEYNLRRAKAIDLERKQSYDPAVIKGWFQRLEATITKYGIPTEDIYNFDETGFRIGIRRDQYIVTREPKKKIYIPLNTNREYITVVEGINTSGWAISPIIIIAAKTIVQGWFDATGTDQNIGIAVSETGYLNDELGYQWIQHFHRETFRRIKGQYRLLICDGFGSHMTYEFKKFCKQQKIILFFLIPHTSHFLQPLDVGVFHAFKHWHSEAVFAASYTGISKFTRVEFLTALLSIREKTFKLRTIQHGFRLTGIVPFYPAQILENMAEYQPPPTPKSPSPISSLISSEATPKNARKFEAYERQINESLDISNLQEKIQRLARGAVQQAYHLHEVERELRTIKERQLQRNKTSKASRKQLQIGGVVFASDLARMARIDRNRNEEKLFAKFERIYHTKVMPELISICLARGIILNRTRGCGKHRKRLEHPELAK
jgi:hypothetical protein